MTANKTLPQGKARRQMSGDDAIILRLYRSQLAAVIDTERLMVERGILQPQERRVMTRQERRVMVAPYHADNGANDG